MNTESQSKKKWVTPELNSVETKQFKGGGATQATENATYHS